MEEDGIGTGRKGTSGFELILAPSRENPERYAIESVKEIDRRAILKTLSTFSLAGILVPVLPESLLARQAEDDTEEASAAARIRVIRLTPRQALSVFETIRRREPDVRALHVNLEERGFAMIRRYARCTVMRSYSPYGAARGEGIVIELAHERGDGTQASFHVSVKNGMAGTGVPTPSAVKVDYTVRWGEQIHTCAILDGQVRCWGDEPVGAPERAVRIVRARRDHWGEGV